MASSIRARTPYFLIVFVVLILDRATKALIHAMFPLHSSYRVIDGFFDITYVRNTGVAFGIFSSTSAQWKAALLSLFTAAAVVMVVVYSMKSSAGNRLLQVALGLILGGALGNLYDRITYGYVIDFLEFYAGSYHWPTFNIADAAISTGVFLLALEIIRGENPAQA